MSDMLWSTRAQIAEAGALLFERCLTDLAGGNISVRVGDRLCMTPRYAGSHHRWHLTPDEVLVLDRRGNRLDGLEEVSREIAVHVKLHDEFYPEGTAVVHAHPRNVLVFCATVQPIPPVLEGTMKFGEIGVAEYAPGGVRSVKLAENVAAQMRGQEDRIRRQAAAVLVPWHGLFALGKDLDSTVDAVERIETNARCILWGRMLLANTDRLDRQRAALRSAFEAADRSGE